ncbi:6436_t:CDS:10 [Funneliformis geosporum]|uniref:6065_t:CDS:1 n=1 Tax=Funneliformis geosporum TaxID=1117311 RepID=A0A9W4WR76_9GLOM|nr:6436_t:CDS:10 [Funneliformis geosporum]CAI2180602.1 6065_t:CDS:10 [Funneliformis geosporum]
MGDPQTYFEEHATWSLISFLQYRRQYAKDFTRDKLKEHRKYTKELDNIISNNESKEKCAQAQKCLNEFDDEKSSPEVEAFWISDSIKLTKLNYAKSTLDKTVEEAKEIRSIVSDETISTLRDDVKCCPYVNTPESKRVLDRDCESDEKPRKRTKTEDDDESECDESDNECELRLNVEEMGFDDSCAKFWSDNDEKLSRNIVGVYPYSLLQMDNYSETQVKTFSRETFEDLRKDIKSKLIGKEKVTRDIKSFLQEYIEVALDDNDGGLHELRETITKSFSKEFNSTAEKEFLRRMKFLFEHLSYTIPLHPLKEIISEGTLVANIISPILRIFFHDSYIYPTIWPNTSSTSVKVRKLAIGDGRRQKQHGKKNLIDLVRLGIFMKDSLDNISRKTGVNRIFSCQVIVTKWTGYMMTLISPGIYVMIDTGSVDLPRSFEVCNTFLTGLNTLFAFQIAYEKTIKDILSIMNKSEEFESDNNFKGWRRSTLGTPSFKKIVKFK